MQSKNYGLVIFNRETTTCRSEHAIDNYVIRATKLMDTISKSVSVIDQLEI